MAQRPSGPLVLASKSEVARLVWVFSELLFGLLLVAWEPSHFSATDSAVGSVLFLQWLGQHFDLFSFFTGKNPIENTWSDTITPWAFKTMRMSQFPGELGRSYRVHKQFLVWLQINQGTRHPLHYSGLGLEHSLLGNWKQIFFQRLRVPCSQNAY